MNVLIVVVRVLSHGVFWLKFLGFCGNLVIVDDANKDVFKRKSLFKKKKKNTD